MSQPREQRDDVHVVQDEVLSGDFTVLVVLVTSEYSYNTSNNHSQSLSHFLLFVLGAGQERNKGEGPGN